jgi:copper transporter 1
MGQYAGTCIFLITFAAIFRGLLDFRAHFYRLLAAVDSRRNAAIAFEPYREEKPIQHQWRAREAILLGLIDVVLASVGYLLCVLPFGKISDRLANTS